MKRFYLIAISLFISLASIAQVGPITGIFTLCVGDTTTLNCAPPGGSWSSSNPAVASIGSGTGFVTAISAGVVTITYDAGAIGFATASLTVNPTPTPFTMTGGGSYCAGGAGVPVGLSGSQTGIMYQLMCSGSPVGAPVAGTGAAISFGLQTTPCVYTVVATDPSTGCRSTMTGSDTVTVNPNPTISGSTPGAHVCVGGTISLTGTPTGGAWTSSNPAVATVGSASGVVTGIVAGVVTITYTLPTGCFATTPLTVNANPGPITGVMTLCQGSTTTLSCSPPGGTWSSGGVNATVGTSTGVVTGINGGTEVITYTSPAGCSTTATVTVNPLPASITGTTTVCIGAVSTLSSSPGGGTWSSSNPSIATVGSATGMVTGISAGGATITYTLPTGCFKTITVSVIATPAPITGPSTGNSVCVYGTITLNSATPGGVWSSSNPGIATIGSSTGLVTGVSAGVTTITYSFGGGCLITTTVTVNPLPAPITGYNMVCLGAMITLTDATPGGTWSTGGTNATVGSSSGIVTGVAVGTAIITYSLPTGCFVTYNVSVNPLPCTPLGVNETMLTGNVEIYPNPAYDVLTIKADEGKYSSVIITNSIGQIVRRQLITGKETTVDVALLPGAIYYVSLRGQDGTVVKRFVKN